MTVLMLMVMVMLMVMLMFMMMLVLMFMLMMMLVLMLVFMFMVMMMLMVMLMRAFLLAVHKDLHVGPCDAAFHGGLGGNGHSGETEGIHFPKEYGLFFVGQKFKQGGREHIAGGAHRKIEIKRFHNAASFRAVDFLHLRYNMNRGRCQPRPRRMLLFPPFFAFGVPIPARLCYNKNRVVCGPACRAIRGALIPFRRL